jgi:hypothetical protein
MTNGVGQKPLPLKFGVAFTLAVTAIFYVCYATIGNTATNGWFATGAAAFELCGILLIASPELRPLIAPLVLSTWDAVRGAWNKIRALMRRLFRRPAVVYGKRASADAGTGADVVRVVIRRDPPKPDADLREITTYLLEQNDLWAREVEALRQADSLLGAALREEFHKSVSQLRTDLDAAVREVKDAELNMRLLGVLLVLIG